MKYLNLLKERYESMGQRERLVWGAGIAAVLLLLILFTAANERIASMEKKRKAREYELFTELRERVARQIRRIMTEAAETFTYEQSARQYIELYEKMLQRPLVVD